MNGVIFKGAAKKNHPCKRMAFVFPKALYFFESSIESFLNSLKSLVSSKVAFLARAAAALLFLEEYASAFSL